MLSVNNFSDLLYTVCLNIIIFFLVFSSIWLVLLLLVGIVRANNMRSHLKLENRNRKQFKKKTDWIANSYQNEKQIKMEITNREREVKEAKRIWNSEKVFPLLFKFLQF